MLDEASATVQNRIKGQVLETGLTSIDKALMAKKYKTVSKLLLEAKEATKASPVYDVEVTEEDILKTSVVCLVFQ